MIPSAAGYVNRNKKEFGIYLAESDKFVTDASAACKQGNFEEEANLYAQAAQVLASGKQNFVTSPNLYRQLDARENRLVLLAGQARLKKQRHDIDHGKASSQPEQGQGVAVNSAAIAATASEAANKTLVTEKAEVHWEDIIGVESAKSAVREAVDVPLRFPQVFAQLKLRPWSGILLYGPPGTGKTMLAQAAACETGCNFFNVKASDLLSYLVGQSEKQVAELFVQAQKCAPAIIFLDECDSLLKTRSDKESEAVMRVKTELFIAMDGFLKTKGVLVIAATNCYDQLDDAALRRFGKRIFVDVPDAEGRRAIFQRKLQGIATSCTDNDYAELARRTEGYTGSDIEKVLTEAKYAVVRRLLNATCFRQDFNGMWTPTIESDPRAMRMTGDPSLETFHVPVHMNDILAALAVTPAVVSQERLQQYRSQYEATQTQ